MTTTSPLATIERLAQERADELALDLNRPDGLARLSRLVADTVERWNAEHRDGRQPVALDEDVVERALRNLVGYGPLGPLLEDDDVWEIMVDTPDALFVKRHRGPDGPTTRCSTTTTTSYVSSPGSSTTRRAPTGSWTPRLGLQDAQLRASGARLHIVHRDLSRGGHTMVNIRKFTGVAYRRLGDLVATGMLDGPTAELLTALVRAGMSMVVAGRPARARPRCSPAVWPSWIPGPGWWSPRRSSRPRCPWPTWPACRPGDHVPTGPRSGSATSWRTFAADGPGRGHRRRGPGPGGTTPAPHPLLRGYRLRQRPRRIGRPGPHPVALHLPAGRGGSRPRPATLTTLVAEAVDVVVHCTHGPDGPRVAEVVAVEDLATGDTGRFTTTPLVVRPPPRPAAGLVRPRA